MVNTRLTGCRCVVTHQLVSQQQDGLQRKLSVAEVEKIFERWAKEIEDHCVVVALGAEPPNERNANATSKSLIDLGLVLELGVLGLDGLELDGDLLARDDVDPEVDVTYRVSDCEV